MEGGLQNNMKPTSNFITVNNITLHYLAYENKHPKILLLHGLTANAFAFNGLIQAGLLKYASVLSVDFRGRGQSSKPRFGYSIKDHALDIVELLNKLNIENIVVCGHSFGGLLASYLAFNFPKRFTKIIFLDAAPEMNSNAPMMLMPAVSRIDKQYKNFDAYLLGVQKAEYMNFWDDAMLPYYIADVRSNVNGTVECISDMSDITQISINVSLENWSKYYKSITQPCALIVAIDNYTMGQPLLPINKAQKILKEMHSCAYKEVEGNHQTMLFGSGANQIVTFIKTFMQP